MGPQSIAQKAFLETIKNFAELRMTRHAVGQRAEHSQESHVNSVFRIIKDKEEFTITEIYF